MPSLPEFTYRLTDKRIIEILVEVETKHSSQAYRNIGVSAEIEIYIQRIANHDKPCSQREYPCQWLSLQKALLSAFPYSVRFSEP